MLACFQVVAKCSLRWKLSPLATSYKFNYTPVSYIMYNVFFGGNKVHRLKGYRVHSKVDYLKSCSTIEYEITESCNIKIEKQQNVKQEKGL